jgi:uncharacterized protein with FMN-binding domain
LVVVTIHSGDHAGSTDDGNVIGGHDGDELTMVMMMVISGSDLDADINSPATSSNGAILNSLSATSKALCKFSGAVLLVRFS